MGISESKQKNVKIFILIPSSFDIGSVTKFSFIHSYKSFNTLLTCQQVVGLNKIMSKQSHLIKEIPIFTCIHLRYENIEITFFFLKLTYVFPTDN